MNAAWVAALVALIGILGGFFVWFTRNAWRIFVKFNQFIEDWNGSPADRGHAARPGVMERIARQETLMTEVQGEMRPNGGGSLKDAVNRTEAAASENGRKITELSGRVGELSAAVEVLRARP